MFFMGSIVSAQDTITVTITSDNAYVFGFGDINGITDYRSGVVNTEATEIYTSGGPEIYTINNASLDGYIYIAAWSDSSGYQGLLAQFTDENTIIKTGSNPSSINNDISWEVYATGNRIYIGYGDNTYPALGTIGIQNVNTINGQIAIANADTGGAGSSKGWVKEPAFTTFNSGKVGVLAIGPSNNAGNPFPLLSIHNIASTAKWIWYYPSLDIPCLICPFKEPAPGGEYYIFRIGPIRELFPSSNDVCCQELRNLIINPSFNQPLAQLTSSQYILDGRFSPGSTTPGEYGLVNRSQANTICSQWKVQDHSVCPAIFNNNSGRFMVVNGETTQLSNVNNIIWQQTIYGIERNSTYKFCVFMKNLPSCCFDVKPKIRIEFTPGGEIPWTTIHTDSDNPCDWQLLEYSFTASSASVTIKIYLDETVAGDGNDLAIDDISLAKLPQTPQQYSLCTLTPINVTSTTFNISASFPPLSFGVGCNNYWKICEIDQNYNCISSTTVTSSQAWWNDNPTTFNGYNGISTLSGINPGVFYLNKRYRITYGVGCDCLSGRESSWVRDPYRGNLKKPIFKEELNTILPLKK